MVKEAAKRAMAGVVWPPSMADIEWARGTPGIMHGATEPWVGQLLAALLVAHGGQDVLELGTSAGYTSVWLVDALQRMGGGSFHGFDHGAGSIASATKHIDALRADLVTVTLEVARSPECLLALPDDSVDFVWVDDDHGTGHVARELAELQRIVRPRGLVCGHDVFGDYSLHEQFRAIGGYSLNTVRRVGSWGVGIWQRPS